MPESAKPSVPHRPPPPVPPNAVRVMAADFNGRTFDGCPFSDAPEWILTAIKTGAIALMNADLDYALWRVGEVIAVPGDLIMREADGTLRVISIEEQRE